MRNRNLSENIIYTLHLTNFKGKKNAVICLACEKGISPLFKRYFFNPCISHSISKPQLSEIITLEDILHAGKKITSQSFQRIILDLSVEQLPKLGKSYRSNSILFSVDQILNEKDWIEAEKKTLDRLTRSFHSL